jgi:hypothetical protein
MWSPTFMHSGGAFAKYVVNNWQLASLCTIQSGRPTGSATIHMNDTPTTMLYSADALDGFNGNFRVPFIPLDSLYTPWVETENFRLTKNIPLPRESMRLALMFEAYNIANNWSPTSLTTQMFTEAKGVLTTPRRPSMWDRATAASPMARRRAACRWPRALRSKLVARANQPRGRRSSGACLSALAFSWGRFQPAAGFSRLLEFGHLLPNWRAEARVPFGEG